VVNRLQDSGNPAVRTDHTCDPARRRPHCVQGPPEPW